MTELQGFPVQVGGSERFEIAKRGWHGSQSENDFSDVVALAQSIENAFLESHKKSSCGEEGLANEIRDVALSEPFRRFLDTVHSARVIGDLLEVEFSPVGVSDHFASYVCIHGSGSRYKLRRLAAAQQEDRAMLSAQNDELAPCPVHQSGAPQPAAPGPRCAGPLPYTPVHPSLRDLQEMVLMVTLGGVSFSVDGLGFLVHFDQWSEDFAIGMATSVGIKGGLTEAHWEVLRKVRCFFSYSGRCPSAHEIIETVGLQPFEMLFPTGFSAGACKLAGLPSHAVFAAHDEMRKAS